VTTVVVTVIKRRLLRRHVVSLKLLPQRLLILPPRLRIHLLLATQILIVLPLLHPSGPIVLLRLLLPNDPLLLPLARLRSRTLLLLNSTLLLPLPWLRSRTLLLLNSPLLLPLPWLRSRTLLLLNGPLLGPNLSLLTTATTVWIPAAPLLRRLHLPLRLTATAAMRVAATVRIATATAVRITAAVTLALSKTANREHNDAQDRKNCLVQMPPVHNSCLPWD